MLTVGWLYKQVQVEIPRPLVDPEKAVKLFERMGLKP